MGHTKFRSKRKKNAAFIHSSHLISLKFINPPHTRRLAFRLQEVCCTEVDYYFLQYVLTIFFHCTASAIIGPIAPSVIVAACFPTSSAQFNLGLFRLLLTVWIRSSIDNGWKITCRIISPSGFLNISPNAISCCSSNNLLNKHPCTRESTSKFVTRLQ